jgi:hypothetical protein
VTSRIDITVPATLSVLAGAASPSSLAELPPGLSLSEVGGSGTLSVMVQAGDSVAQLGASGAGVSGAGDLLTLSGSLLDINTALASLTLTEPVGTTGDVLTITAVDGALSAASAFAVDVISPIGPAFVAPPSLVTLVAGSLASVPGLFISDPIAQGLAQMGLGGEETLSLTLSVAQGVLLLPGMDGLYGVAATGLGSGQIELSFTANQIAQVNALLSSLAFAGASSWGENLDYELWNLTGPAPRSVTSGNMFLYFPTTHAVTGTLLAGAETLVQGAISVSGTADFTGQVAVLGPIDGAIMLDAGAELQVPETGVSLTGISDLLGQLGAASLVEAGRMITALAPDIAGLVQVGANAVIEFENGFTAGGTIGTDYAPVLSLGAGAVLEGAGTLVAGYFSESGLITGPGTILALGGETLSLDAGEITGGAVLAVAGGAAMELGPVDQLYGIFADTPLTIASSVTLSFLTPGAQALGGGYASTLGGGGGAFVISGPQAYGGTITGFEAGDELIFPGLTGVSVYNPTSSGFDVAGVDQSGSTQSFSFVAAIPTGLAVASGFDVGGDAVVYLRPAAATLVSGAALAASAGSAQLLAGLELELATGTTRALSLTLSAQFGSLSLGGTSFAPVLTLGGANLAALNAELADVYYLGSGIADNLTLAATSGVPGGLSETLLIGAGGSGMVSADAGGPFTSAETVDFANNAAIGQVTAPLDVGGLLVSKLVDFEGQVNAVALTGTALIVDDQGTALFGAASHGLLTGNVTLGDALGAGTLDVLGSNVSITGNLVMGASAGTSGAEAFIAGTAQIGGTIVLGLGASSSLHVSGSLGAAALTMAGRSTLWAFADAELSLGTVENGGTIWLADHETGSFASYQGGGSLVVGGQADVSVGSVLSLTGGLLEVGAGATLMAANLAQSGGTIRDSGLIAAGASASLGAVSLSGGTLSGGGLTDGGQVSGYGLIEAKHLTLTGGAEAVGGRLVLGGAVSDAGVLTVAATGTLELTGTASGAGGVSFTGGNALLVLDDPFDATLPVSGMGGGDGIDLMGVAPGAVRVAGGTVEIDGLPGFALSASGSITILSDNAGGALLTVNGQMPCFARGTSILTPHGYRPVEEFRPGDPVITAFGQSRPVRWVGWRTLDLAEARGNEAYPILISAHAFGPGRPGRPLRLSPNHCVYSEGVLIPVTQLVNGATIKRERSAKAATYFHLELDRHDILLADGLPCESYFDDGNRAQLYTEVGRRSPAFKPFAPVVTKGLRLIRARRALGVEAEALGFTRTYQPHVKAFADGMTALPDITQAAGRRLARFSFPRPVRRLTLLSTTAAPAETEPESDDWRDLGICLAPMPGVRLGAGWHHASAGDEGAWMGTRAELAFTQARADITLTLAAIAQSWARFGDHY